MEVDERAMSRKTRRVAEMAPFPEIAVSLRLGIRINAPSNELEQKPTREHNYAAVDQTRHLKSGPLRFDGSFGFRSWVVTPTRCTPMPA